MIRSNQIATGFFQNLEADNLSNETSHILADFSDYGISFVSSILQILGYLISLALVQSFEGEHGSLFWRSMMKKCPTLGWAIHVTFGWMYRVFVTPPEGQSHLRIHRRAVWGRWMLAWIRHEDSTIVSHVSIKILIGESKPNIEDTKAV